MNDIQPTHLGDGAYITLSNNELIVTANHHDPSMASDIVIIDHHGLQQLLNLLKQTNPQLFQ